MDACSLYPYVMSIMNVFYPTGNIKKVDMITPGKLGIYNVWINQACLRTKNLPNIIAYKNWETLENDWEKDEFETWIVTPEYETLLKFGCDVELIEIFEYETCTENYNIFGWVLDLMKAKNEQDMMKLLKLPKYNAAMRAVDKLFMNGGSGKAAESLHLNKTLLWSALEYKNIVNAGKMESINIVNIFKDWVQFTVKSTVESELSDQKPIIWSTYIYAYARMHMYEHVYSIIGKDCLLYTDTDSAKFL